MKKLVYIRSLVKEHGSKNAAARYIGCTSSTMQRLYASNAVFIDGVLYIQSSSRAKLPEGGEQ